MKIVYVLTLENYRGEYSFELFYHKKNAERRYNELLKANRRKEEFECDDGSDECVRVFSFFDPTFNEYSTYITLVEKTLEQLFEDYEDED